MNLSVNNFSALSMDPRSWLQVTIVS